MKIKNILKIAIVWTLLIFIFISCNNDDKNQDEITGIILNKYRIEVNVTESFNLTAKIIPENVNSGNIIWKSENPDIATVDNNGKVTGVQRGETKISASAGGKTANCLITVKNRENNVTIYTSGGHVNETGKIWQDDKLLYEFSDVNYAQSIYVVDNNIYAAGGSISINSKVWKNGKLLYELPDADHLYSIFVVGNDVFTAGMDIMGKAKVWKNDKFLYDLNGYSAKSIYINGNDIYVCGNSKDGGLVWKNGEVLYNLSDAIVCNSIFFENGNLYVGGGSSASTQFQGKIWKNGNLLYETKSIIHSIYVVDNDVYAITNEGLYKNNVLLYELTLPKSVFVLDNDVYAAGGTNNTSGLIWKNGKLLYTLPNSNTNVTSMFVVKR